MIRFLHKHWLFLIILLFGIFLRSYKASDLFMYSHDQDLSGWIIRNILESKHLRLIGQETTSKGVFTGPFYYYLLIPFYLLFNMDPIGGVYLSIIVGAFSIFSFYFVFKEIFGKNVGIFASLFYSFSFYTIFTDREVVPTIFAMLWSVWFFYCLFLFLKGKKKSYLLSGFLLGVAWNINLALLLVLPLILVAIFLSRKKVNFKYLSFGFLVLTFVSLPFIFFEFKHGFIQTKSIYFSLTSEKDYVQGAGQGLAKLDRVMQLVKRNTTRLLWGDEAKLPDSLALYVFIGVFIYLLRNKKIPIKLAIIMILWQITYVLFFTKNPINVSEYYLNGMNVIWICLFAVFVGLLFEKKGERVLGVIVLGLFIYINLYRFFNLPVNKSGYIERRALVSTIKKDAKIHGYQCVSVSYITEPGFDLGYRYLFFLEKMHVNRPSSGSPPYTIVFPISMVDRVDETFGALGLVLPDYGRYTKEAVEKSCSGANSNLTDPMLGYTE